jgi:prophage regulatory protein
MRFIKMSDVIERVGLSRTTLWRRTRAGEFPKPIRFANGRVCYRLDAVEEWMHAQVAHAARAGALPPGVSSSSRRVRGSPREALGQSLCNTKNP